MSYKHALTFIAAAALALSLGACGDKARKMDHAAAALAEYYASHPFEREWDVQTIAILDSDNKLLVKVQMNDENDVQRLKLLSRMEQFTVAKLGCPQMTPALLDALDGSRVWIQLHDAKEELTSSICPQN